MSGQKPTRCPEATIPPGPLAAWPPLPREGRGTAPGATVLSAAGAHQTQGPGGQGGRSLAEGGVQEGPQDQAWLQPALGHQGDPVTQGQGWGRGRQGESAQPASLATPGSHESSMVTLHPPPPQQGPGATGAPGTGATGPRPQGGACPRLWLHPAAEGRALEHWSRGASLVGFWHRVGTVPRRASDGLAWRLLGHTEGRWAEPTVHPGPADLLAAPPAVLPRPGNGDSDDP